MVFHFIQSKIRSSTRSQKIWLLAPSLTSPTNLCLSYSALSTVAFSLFLKHARHSYYVSEPLLLLFTLPGILFPLTHCCSSGIFSELLPYHPTESNMSPSVLSLPTQLYNTLSGTSSVVVDKWH